MSIVVEVSREGTNWEPYDRSKTRIDDYRFIRNIDTVERNWSSAQIKNWLNDKQRIDGTHIEYSTDDGFSFNILRLNGNDDAARIWTVIQRNKYIVRAVTLTEQIAAFNASQSGSGNVTAPLVAGKPKVKREVRWVTCVNTPNGIEWGIAKTLPPKGQWISMIESDIVMSLSEANRNFTTMYDKRMNADKPYLNGHVYELRQCDSLPPKWIELMRQHRHETVNPTDWAWVEGARAYDDSTIAIGGTTYAMTVLSDKYFVTNEHSPFKLGHVFLIRREHAQPFIDNVANRGGVAMWRNTPLTIARANTWEPQKESSLSESIMSMKAELQAAIDTRDQEILAKTFFEAVELRDSTIDALKELNATIAKAREVAMELISGSQP